jgi:hypothetical protein
MIGLPMAYHALGRKADSDAALAALIAKYEKDAPPTSPTSTLSAARRQGVRVARQGVNGSGGLAEIVTEHLFDKIHADPALAAVPAQDRQGAGATGEDRVQGDAATMSMRIYTDYAGWRATKSLLCSNWKTGLRAPAHHSC